MKISLSALSASVLACLGMTQTLSAHAVPNPVALVEQGLAQPSTDGYRVQTKILPIKSTEELDEPKPDLQTSTTNTKAMQIAQAVVSSDGVLTDDVQELLMNCASLTQDAMRLACYDTLAQGDMPTAGQNKRPIKLGDTLWQAIKGQPKVIYSDTDNDSKAVSASSLAENEQLSEAEAKQLEQVARKFTPLSLAFDLDRNNTPLWTTRPHNPMYVLPLFLNAKPNRSPSTPTQDVKKFSNNEMREAELKFQLSFKVKAIEDLLGTNADVWFGYTQQSHWQIYNEDNSRPFRSHDYQPELFLTQPVYSKLPFDGRLRMVGAGVVHHSNGEDDPMSRSWNRAYLMAGMEWGNLTVMPRLWARILKEGNGKKPDDNPDILDYYGYGDVQFLYQLQNKSNISGLVRYNPKTNKGAVQLDYVRPLGKGVSGYVQLFKGYGQSLIDYNYNATGIGIGLMLNDWMGL